MNFTLIWAVCLFFYVSLSHPFIFHPHANGDQTWTWMASKVSSILVSLITIDLILISVVFTCHSLPTLPIVFVEVFFPQCFFPDFVSNSMQLCFFQDDQNVYLMKCSDYFNKSQMFMLHLYLSHKNNTQKYLHSIFWYREIFCLLRER